MHLYLVCFIVINFFLGQYRSITAAEEQLLSEGKNYEHSLGAVHTSKLELLLRLKNLLVPAEQKLHKANPGKWEKMPVRNFFS